GATRTAEWRNAPCFFCLPGFVLSLAQRAGMLGATRNVMLLRAVWLSGSGATRSVLVSGLTLVDF
ncbi:hypothetical protein A2U01_0084719, partial [Trifolium medium]|nr:hypothetical protein [Trifolium medium]